MFALALEVVAFAVLWAGANLLSAVLALGAAAFYVGVYTLWLKRTSTQNIVIGGAAGAVPVLVGWAAVTDSLAWTPVVLFVVMFFWTPPHFWALAIRYADDYRAADVPMLPAVAPLDDAARQMIGYTVALVVATLVLIPVADLGWIYAVAAVVLGAGFLVATVALGAHPTPAASMRVFGYSITYVTLLFGAMTLDVLVLTAYPGHAAVGRWDFARSRVPTVTSRPIAGRPTRTGTMSRFADEHDRHRPRDRRRRPHRVGCRRGHRQWARVGRRRG